MTLYPYDRQAAVDYAHRWAYHRNPNFYNFDELGGDCTNFASQCLYAGTGVMNYTPHLRLVLQQPVQPGPRLDRSSIFLQLPHPG